MIFLNIRILIVLVMFMILSIIPMPDALLAMRPAWVLLLVLYMQFFIPEGVGIVVLIIIGLCLDALLATPLGVHALALLLTSWAVMAKAKRFRFFSVIQQILLIILLCSIYQGTLVLVDMCLGYTPKNVLFLGAIITSSLAWPWVKWALDSIVPKKYLVRL